MYWHRRAEEAFEVKIARQQSEKLQSFLADCANVYRGQPQWLGDGVKTINLAKTICSETARLAVMNIDINVEGSDRAEWLKGQLDEVKTQLRKWTEYACGFGTVILKPNGESVECVTPDQFVVTSSKMGKITGVCFIDKQYNSDEDKWYTRLEYHRIDDGKYLISNKCYKGESEQDMATSIPIKDSPWKDMDEEVTAENVDGMLFGVLTMPNANVIDIHSPLGVPIFAEALTELEDLDIAYSRNAEEINDSKRTVLLDSDRLMVSGGKVGQQNRDFLVANAGLPKYVRMVEGTGQGDIYHEINPTLSTAVRLQGINSLTSEVGYKCGFSNGYFVFDQKTGMVTATQVESDDRRTLQLVNDIRAQIKTALDQLVYALNQFADGYNLSASGDYEVNYDFDDLTINKDEDRLRFLGQVQQGLFPYWRYLTRFEGYTEEEAKEIVAEMEEQRQQAAQMATLFG